MRGSERRGRHVNLLIIVLSVVSCLGVVKATGYYILTYSRETGIQTTPEPLVAERSVKAETLSDPEERQQELNSVVEEGMMIFSVNTTPFMTDRKGKANLMVENPFNNGKRLTVTIQRNGTGEAIYESGYLDPEQYIDEVPLDVGLAKGEYICTAYFDACRLSSDGYIGRTGT